MSGSYLTVRSAARRGPNLALARIEGRAEITFRRAGGATWLIHLYQSAPLRVLFPDVPRGELAPDVDAPGGFGGAVAMASIVYAADDAPNRRDLARQIFAGATVVGGILIIRWLARDALALRRDYGRFWARFRARAGGHPARLPRLWQI